MRCWVVMRSTSSIANWGTDDFMELDTWVWLRIQWKRVKHKVESPHYADFPSLEPKSLWTFFIALNTCDPLQLPSQTKQQQQLGFTSFSRHFLNVAHFFTAELIKVTHLTPPAEVSAVSEEMAEQSFWAFPVLRKRKASCPEPSLLPHNDQLRAPMKQPITLHCRQLKTVSSYTEPVVPNTSILYSM